MKQLKQRIARLEGAATGKERLIIAVGPDGFDVDLALASLGLEVGPSDLVVAVNGKPDEEPVTVTVDSVAIERSGRSPFGDAC